MPGLPCDRGWFEQVLYDVSDWYEGVIQAESDKKGEYCVRFDDDQTENIKIPGTDGDVELILEQAELCERIASLLDPKSGLLFSLVRASLLKCKVLKSISEVPAPYVELLRNVAAALTKKIRYTSKSRVGKSRSWIDVSGILSRQGGEPTHL